MNKGYRGNSTIRLWNTSLDKCIKYVICSFESFLNMSHLYSDNPDILPARRQ
jgi:hypothetical protein